MGAVAGHDQVTDAAEPLESFCLASERAPDAYHLCQPARHESRFGIVPEPEPVADPGRDGKDILHGAADLDPCDVIAGVGAKPR